MKDFFRQNEKFVFAVCDPVYAVLNYSCTLYFSIKINFSQNYYICDSVILHLVCTYSINKSYFYKLNVKSCSRGLQKWGMGGEHRGLLDVRPQLCLMVPILWCIHYVYIHIHVIHVTCLLH